jgi:hypothetical protein
MIFHILYRYSVNFARQLQGYYLSGLDLAKHHLAMQGSHALVLASVPLSGLGCCQLLTMALKF